MTTILNGEAATSISEMILARIDDMYYTVQTVSILSRRIECSGPYEFLAAPRSESNFRNFLAESFLR